MAGGSTPRGLQLFGLDSIVLMEKSWETDVAFVGWLIGHLLEEGGREDHFH